MNATSNETDKCGEDEQAEFYLFAAPNGVEWEDAEFVFYKVRGERIAAELCKLFAGLYGDGRLRMTFYKAPADAITLGEQVLLDEVVEELEAYRDPDSGLYEPEVRKTFMELAQYAVKASEWEKRFRKKIQGPELTRNTPRSDAEPLKPDRSQETADGAKPVDYEMLTDEASLRAIGRENSAALVRALEATGKARRMELPPASAPDDEYYAVVSRRLRERKKREPEFSRVAHEFLAAINEARGEIVRETNERYLYLEAVRRVNGRALVDEMMETRGWRSSVDHALSEPQEDLAAELLENIEDWRCVLQDMSPSQQLECQRSLSGLLQRMAANGVGVFTATFHVGDVNPRSLMATMDGQMVLVAPINDARIQTNQQGEEFIPTMLERAPKQKQGQPEAKVETATEKAAHAIADGLEKKMNAGFAKISNEVQGVAQGVETVGLNLKAVAEGNYELRRENDELRRLHAEGYFKFALKVDAADFQAFAVIIALGNRKAAAEHLKIPHRSFYDRVDKWSQRGREYQLMRRFIEWRKRSARHIEVRLDESLQSGESGGQAENPDTLRETLEAVNASESANYPDLLADIFGALHRQNAANWSSVRGELLNLIREELPQ